MSRGSTRPTRSAWWPYLAWGGALWLLTALLAWAEVAFAERLVLAQLAIPARLARSAGWTPSGSEGAYALLLAGFGLVAAILYGVVEKLVAVRVGTSATRAAIAWAGVEVASLVAAVLVDLGFRHL